MNAGHHLRNSVSQLSITLVGTTIRWGPHIPLSQARCARRAMVMIVFPRPISSAKIPFNLFSYIVTSQSKPMCWYSRKECLRRNGNFVLTFVVEYVNPVGCADLAAAAASAILSLLSLASSSFISLDVPSSFSEQGCKAGLHSADSTFSSSESACCLISDESSSDKSLPPKSYNREIELQKKRTKAAEQKHTGGLKAYLLIPCKQFFNRHFTLLL